MTTQMQSYIGWLGQNPEQITSKSGAIGAKFKLGINYYVGKGETRTKKTDWFQVNAWGELAKEVLSHFKKGSKAIVYGPIHSYQKPLEGGGSTTAYYIDAKEIGAAFNTYAPQQGMNQNPNQQWSQNPKPYQNTNPYPPPYQQPAQNQQRPQGPAGGNFSQFGPAYNEPPQYEQDEIPF